MKIPTCHHPIQFNPFTNNVLDYVGREDLITPDGDSVKIVCRMGGGFDVTIKGKTEKNFNNLAASAWLNKHHVGNISGRPE